MKVGEGEGKEGNFLPHPLPALLLTPFFARSLTLVPRSLLLNRTETLATQASRCGEVAVSRDSTVFCLLHLLLFKLSRFHRRRRRTEGGEKTG